MVRMSTTPGLFLETLHTINDILSSNAGREPFRSMIESARERLSGRLLTIAVYQGRPEIEVDHFTIRFNGDRFDLIGRGRESETIDWLVPHAFLEDVVDNQDRYRENPELLDWPCLAPLLSEPGPG